MQERYLGDSHDYVKYALLRHLHRHMNIRLGVNWYLTEPSVDHPANKDGEKRHYLKGGIWEKWDKELFNRIMVFKDKTKRVLNTIRIHRILPDSTLYFDEIVLAVSQRQEWHQRSLKTLETAHLVFLDPDNGFKVKSATSKTLAKYCCYEEVVDYYRTGKIVVVIQFARQCNPNLKAQEVRTSLYKHADYSDSIPVIRARVAPNILFLFLASSEVVKSLTEAITSFVDLSRGKVELVR
jgi:hypothetical protein